MELLVGRRADSDGRTGIAHFCSSISGSQTDIERPPQNYCQDNFPLPDKSLVGVSQLPDDIEM
jgi:hypothetical protein